MSTSNQQFLIERCLAQSEPCVPEWNDESWFSIPFVASVLGYDNLAYFARKVNEAKLPRHPMQSKCIRFSDTGKIKHEQPAEN